MFEYNIAPVADNKKFSDTCILIQDNVPDLVKAKPLTDVDGSLIQVYTQGTKEITVQNDYEVGAVYVDSEIEIPILNK